MVGWKERRKEEGEEGTVCTHCEKERKKRKIIEFRLLHVQLLFTIT